MKKKLLAMGLVAALTVGCLTGCTEANRVSYNISEEADNFNICRQIIVINNETDKILYEFEGFASITSDNESNQLEITSEVGNNKYKKDLIYLNSHTTYVVKDIEGSNVDKYHYEWHVLPTGNILNTKLKVSD